MRASARRRPIPIASGTNCDDLADFRPGLRAATERDVVHPYVEAAIDKAHVYALAAGLGLDDLERLPAQPCLASRVETGIAIAPDDLAFIDAVETRLAARMGREAVLRCRVTHAGIVIELGAAARSRQPSLSLGAIGRRLRASSRAALRRRAALRARSRVPQRKAADG